MSARAVFHCFSCGENRPHSDAQLDRDDNLVCGACYLLDPPQQDIDLAIDAIAERLAREARQQKTRDRWDAMNRAHDREIKGVCDTCGGRTCNGRCGRDCE